MDITKIRGKWDPSPGSELGIQLGRVDAAIAMKIDQQQIVDEARRMLGECRDVPHSKPIAADLAKMIDEGESRLADYDRQIEDLQTGLARMLEDAEIVRKRAAGIQAAYELAGSTYQTGRDYLNDEFFRLVGRELEIFTGGA